FDPPDNDPLTALGASPTRAQHGVRLTDSWCRAQIGHQSAWRSHSRPSLVVPAVPHPRESPWGQLGPAAAYWVCAQVPDRESKIMISADDAARPPSAGT